MTTTNYKETINDRLFIHDSCNLNNKVNNMSPGFNDT